MSTVKIIETDQGQSVPLPDEFRFETPTVSIRRAGDAVILEPVKPDQWPEGFFEAIRIDDPAFVRPPRARRRSPDLAALPNRGVSPRSLYGLQIGEVGRPAPSAVRRKK
jgi:virulence-associated protein VagC